MHMHTLIPNIELEVIMMSCMSCMTIKFNSIHFIFADVTGVEELDPGDQSDALALHNSALYNIPINICEYSYFIRD